MNDNAANDTEANEESGHDRVMALIDELTIQSQAIDKALQRIEDGLYGSCVSCGGSIGDERLRINPTADRCIHCQKHSS
ncbi:MAG: TraR/DksA family transcriptional regulator [Patescibacteria group bacterium]|nr:TraR/DksA family transcriptional regulator [Patescibacteria group bacterium]